MAAFDDIDRWYASDTFAEDVDVSGTPARGIVSSVATTEPIVIAGKRTAQVVRVRVRKSEVDTRPAARTILTRLSDGSQYRIMGAVLGSTGLEWMIDCIQEVSA